MEKSLRAVLLNILNDFFSHSENGRKNFVFSNTSLPDRSRGQSRTRLAGSGLLKFNLWGGLGNFGCFKESSLAETEHSG